MNYDIVIASNLSEMIKEVRRRMEQGWEPIGGVTLAGMLHAQAVIKKEAPPNEVGEAMEQLKKTVKKKTTARRRKRQPLDPAEYPEST